MRYPIILTMMKVNVFEPVQLGSFKKKLDSIYVPSSPKKSLNLRKASCILSGNRAHRSPISGS